MPSAFGPDEAAAQPLLAAAAALDPSTQGTPVDDRPVLARVESPSDDVIVPTQAAELPGTHRGGFTRPPKPFNAAQQRLFEAVRETGGLIGQQVAWKASGGVCEGNNLFAAGLPNADSLGVRGGDIHSTNEFAWPGSFAERAQLSGLILMRLARGEIDGPGLREAMRA